MNICYIYADLEEGWNCSEWRCAVPARAMNRSNKHQASMLFNQDFGFNTGDAQEKCSQADILIVQRNLFGPVHRAIQHWKAQGKLVIAEFDDAFDLIPPDVKNREFWIGGIDARTGPDGVQFINKIIPPPLTQFKIGLKLVDGATTPSKTLCGDWESYTNVYYLPNYLEVDRYTRVSPAAPHTGIQIGWGGSLSHTQSFNNSGIMTALKRVCEARPQVKLVLCGDKRNYDEMPVPTEQKIYQSYVPVDQWPEVLSTFDIGLAPLYGAFDDRRSWIKIMEYMIMKIPWIASDGPAYADQRQFGALVKNGPGNWERALLDTIDHLEERKNYAAGVPYQYALKQSIDANIDNIINLYNSIKIKARESVW